MSLELRIAPDLIAIVVAVMMWLARGVGSGFASVGVPWDVRLRWIAIALYTLGVVLIILARLAFSRRKTPFGPFDPTRAVSLVTDGVFRFSRNPMYLGTWLILLGLAASLGSAVAVAISMAYVVWIDRWQIVPEERALQSKFGEAYDSYRREVRRWV